MGTMGKGGFRNYFMTRVNLACDKLDKPVGCVDVYMLCYSNTSGTF